MLSLFVGSTNLVRWDSMRNRATGAYVNNAVVTATIRNSSLEAVAGGTAALAYVESSNGRYQGILPSTLDLTVGESYFLDVRAVSGTAVGFCRIACTAVYRGQN